LWIGRLVVLAALVVVQAAMAPWRRRDVVLVLLAVGFAGSLVGVGHGMTGAGHGVAAARIHMAADVTHLLCAFAWIGGLFGLGQLVRAAMTEKTSPDAVRVALERFSGAGYWVVALLLITGCINAFVMVPRPDSLLTSDYGRVLVVKIVFALMMVAIALLNRIALAPALAGAVTGAPGPAVLRKLWRSVLVEQVVGVLVLIVVARLGTIHPVP
jgi:putative copper resistance protein D